MKKLLALFTFVFIFTVSGCANVPTETENEKPKVYASFYAMYDFARMIGGDNIELVCMVPAGAEPHDWEPSPSDIAGLEKADVFIYSGSNMEHWTESVIPTLSNKNLKTVSITDSNLIDFGDYTDPHLWLSPDIAVGYMEIIKNVLSETDPENAAVYEQNYEKHKQMANDLKTKIETVAQSFKTHDIVVSHEAYGYLCRLCGINQIEVEGLAGESDPSPARMAEIAKQIKEKNIKYIFTEPGESSKTIDTLAAETGAEVLVLHPFEFDENGKDYFTVMEENLEALKKALG